MNTALEPAIVTTLTIFMLSQKVLSLKPSPTISLDAKVKELEAQGVSIVNLGLGEPDFATPEHIAQTGIQAIQNGFTHYTAVGGIAELKNAIVHSLATTHRLTYAPSEIIVGVGSKAILYNIFQALCNPHDEVILSTPTWSTYIEQIKLAGGVPVLIPLQSPFKLTAQDIAKKITPKTKIVLLNSPANPTGALIDPAELMQIAELARTHSLLVVSDEIYDRILFTNTPYISIASLTPDMQTRTVVVNGFSKTYAMTGWRIGYAAGPKEIISALSALQGQITSNAPSMAQKAAITALAGDQTAMNAMLHAFTERRTYLQDAFAKLSPLNVTVPEGAFYFFVGIQKLLNDRYPTSAAWCAGLLEKEHVAVVPGEAFECPGYFRLSFASSLKNLKLGIAGIQRFITA